MEIPILSAVRRHHAVEHATIAVLHQRRGRIIGVFGRSDSTGFHIYGPFDPEEIESATEEALRRLRSGETYLAISPFCGTNIATTGAMAGGAALLAAGRNRRSNWSNALAAATLATLAAARVGLWLQREVTTDATVGDMQVTTVRKYRPLRGTQHAKVFLSR